MADLETIHRIIEKIEVTNAKNAAKDIHEVGRKSDAAAKNVDRLKKSLAEVSAKQVKQDRPKEQSQVEEKGFSKKQAALVALGIAAVGVEIQLSKLREQADKLNKELDQTADKLTRIALAKTKLGEIKDPKVRLGDAEKLSEVQLKRYRQMGIELGMPMEKLKEISDGLTPLFAGTKRTVGDMMKMTRAAARAAAVFKASPEEVVAKATSVAETGVAEDDLSKRILKEAGFKKGDNRTQRLAKVEAALQKLGARAEEFSQKKEDNLTRRQEFLNDLMERASRPAHKEMQAAEAADEKRKTERLLSMRGDLEAAADIFGGLWGKYERLKNDIYSAAGDMVGRLADWGWSLAKGPVVDGLGWVYEMVERIKDAASDVGQKFSEWWKEGSDWATDKINRLKKLAGIKDKAADLSGGDMGPPVDREKLARDARDAENNDKWEKLKRKIAAWSSDQPSSEMGPPVPDGLRRKNEEERLLATYFGRGNKEALIKVDTLNMIQNFRSGDPDDVMYEVTRAFERLSEAAVQSLAGGTATTFGPGANYGR